MSVVSFVAALFLVLNVVLPMRFSDSTEVVLRTDIPSGFPQNAPAPRDVDTPEVQKGFQHLVSFTDSGFVPAVLVVKKGETVRFTNNSAASLQILIEGEKSLPLAHGQYWEHTFTQKNVIEYSAGDITGTINVR